MRITRRHLRRIIKEEICRITEIGPGVGMDPTGATMPVGMKRSEYRQLEDAQTDAHSILAAMSIADPTMATELADAALYALEGDSESAALVLALSAGGIGAGALAVKTAKMVKGMKAAGVSASKAAKAADDVVTSGKNLDTAGKSRPPSKLPRQKKSTRSKKSLSSKKFLPAGTLPPSQAPTWIDAKLSKPGYITLYRGQKNQHMNITKSLTDTEIGRLRVVGEIPYAKRTAAETEELKRLFERSRSQNNFFADSAENAASYAGENGTVYGVRIPEDKIGDYLAPRGFTQGGGFGNFVIPGDDLIVLAKSGDMVGTGPVKFIQ